MNTEMPQTILSDFDKVFKDNIPSRGKGKYIIYQMGCTVAFDKFSYDLTISPPFYLSNERSSFQAEQYVIYQPWDYLSKEEFVVE